MTDDKFAKLLRDAEAILADYPKARTGRLVRAVEQIPALVAEVERLTAERDADRADVVALCEERLDLVAERDEARAGWTKAMEIATEASNQRDQALAALETAVDALRSGT